MTVYSRIVPSCNFPNSANGSDSESLHLGSAATSDAESLHAEPSEPSPGASRTRGVWVSTIEDVGKFKRKWGKRKQRRLKNRLELEILLEEDEDESQSVRLMERYKGPFTRLLQDTNALNYWREFITLPEEEQAKLIDPVPKQALLHHGVKPIDPWSRISSKIISALEDIKSLPLEKIEDFEDQIIEYFTMDPLAVLYYIPKTSFERLMLHAIARYHNLVSENIHAEDICSVEIYGSDVWKPMEVRFCNCVLKLRQ